MARETFQTLTEPMYYVLMALLEECCGVDIMKKVEDLSGSRVKVGPGTLYAMLDKFLKNKLIEETKAEGRKRSYIITAYGKELLIKEYNRLKQMVMDGANIIEHI
ncbi:MAG: PadR family transcriptional regulator [Cellulosilyticum sp.]|nr:PadR family transcriptional regulator [Cellulosilyticum sp.]